MDIEAITIIIIVGVLLVITFYIIGLYNELIDARNRVEDRFTQIELELRKKNNLIPDLIEIVKIYAKHEEKIINEMIATKNKLEKSNKINDIIKNSKNIDISLNKIFTLTDTYPELKKNKNYLSLQKNVEEIEDKINYARTFYNEAVLNYNNSRLKFPSNIVANIFKFNEIEYFK